MSKDHPGYATAELGAIELAVAIGTVIMGRQEVTAMYPEGWFDE